MAAESLALFCSEARGRIRLRQLLAALAPTLLRAVARGARVITNEHHLPPPDDAKAVAALPPDCRALAHLLTPEQTNCEAQLCLYRAKCGEPPRPASGSSAGL